MENHLKKMPSPLLSLVPILVLVALLFVTIRTFGSDALSGGSQVVLLTTTAVASLLAMIFCKVKWRDIEEAICKNILGVATAIIILLLIGALSGSWMISGIVPTFIYYGMQIIHPHDRYRLDGYRRGTRFRYGVGSWGDHLGRLFRG